MTSSSRGDGFKGVQGGKDRGEEKCEKGTEIKIALGAVDGQTFWLRDQRKSRLKRHPRENWA